MMTSSLSTKNKESDNSVELISFGAVHLNNTNLNKSIDFWTKIVGMKLRHASNDIAELGTETDTLIVVHQAAKLPFKEGYSGLYHFAIHATDKYEFAKMFYRLWVNNYTCSPTDHTMSKSIYLKDPDGITLEFTLETPERFKRVVTNVGLAMEDIDGTIRPGAAKLDIDDVFKHLTDKDLSKTIAAGTRIGHIHLYVSDVVKSNEFYKRLGFVQFNKLLQYQYADLGTGGAYQHRIALNTWHGTNKPLAPKENAGLQYYQIIYHSKEALKLALNNTSTYEEKDGGFWIVDPTGNLLVISNQ